MNLSPMVEFPKGLPPFIYEGGGLVKERAKIGAKYGIPEHRYNQIFQDSKGVWRFIDDLRDNPRTEPRDTDPTIEEYYISREKGYEKDSKNWVN